MREIKKSSLTDNMVSIMGETQNILAQSFLFFYDLKSGKKNIPKSKNDKTPNFLSLQDKLIESIWSDFGKKYEISLKDYKEKPEELLKTNKVKIKFDFLQNINGLFKIQDECRNKKFVIDLQQYLKDLANVYKQKSREKVEVDLGLLRAFTLLLIQCNESFDKETEEKTKEIIQNDENWLYLVDLPKTEKIFNKINRDWLISIMEDNKKSVDYIVKIFSGNMGKENSIFFNSKKINDFISFNDDVLKNYQIDSKGTVKSMNDMIVYLIRTINYYAKLFREFYHSNSSSFSSSLDILHALYVMMNKIDSVDLKIDPDLFLFENKNSEIMYKKLSYYNFKNTKYNLFCRYLAASKKINEIFVYNIDSISFNTKEKSQSSSHNHELLFLSFFNHYTQLQSLFIDLSYRLKVLNNLLNFSINFDESNVNKIYPFQTIKSVFISLSYLLSAIKKINIFMLNIKEYKYIIVKIEDFFPGMNEGESSEQLNYLIKNLEKVINKLFHYIQNYSLVLDKLNQNEDENADLLITDEALIHHLDSHFQYLARVESNVDPSKHDFSKLKAIEENVRALQYQVTQVHSSNEGDGGSGEDFAQQDENQFDHNFNDFTQQHEDDFSEENRDSDFQSEENFQHDTDSFSQENESGNFHNQDSYAQEEEYSHDNHENEEISGMEENNVISYQTSYKNKDKLLLHAMKKIRKEDTREEDLSSDDNSKIDIAKELKKKQLEKLERMNALKNGTVMEMEEKKQAFLDNFKALKNKEYSSKNDIVEYLKSFQNIIKGFSLANKTFSEIQLYLKNTLVKNTFKFENPSEKIKMKKSA